MESDSNGNGRRSRTTAVMNETAGAVLAERVRRADTFLSRLVGLMGRKRLPDGEGLWIRPCRGIHTMWMRFPIDAIFLNESQQVVDLREDVAPWRSTGFIKGAVSVLELPAGWIQRAGVSIGDRLDVMRGDR